MRGPDDRRHLDELTIRDLVVRFSDAVTRGDWDRFEATFTPDAVWEESAPFAGRYSGARSIRESVASSMAAVDLYVQMAHGTVVTSLTGSRATATTTIQGVSGVGDVLVVNFGIYFDDLVRTADGWRFEHRWLQNVYAETGPLGGRIPVTRAELAAMPSVQDG
jgi:hypothetical protein